MHKKKLFKRLKNLTTKAARIKIPVMTKVWSPVILSLLLFLSFVIIFPQISLPPKRLPLVLLLLLLLPSGCFYLRPNTITPVTFAPIITFSSCCQPPPGTSYLIATSSNYFLFSIPAVILIYFNFLASGFVIPSSAIFNGIFISVCYFSFVFSKGFTTLLFLR